MVHFTFHSNQLAEKDIFAINKMDSLSEFLEEEYSLTVVHAPQFCAGTGLELIRVTGKNDRGEPDKLWVGKCGNGRDQGYVRCKLDKILLSPFLFASWKKSKKHEFKLVQQHKVLAQFENFDDALRAYLPDGFTPEFSYQRNKSLIYLMCLAQQRRKNLKGLATLLAQYRTEKAAIET